MLVNTENTDLKKLKQSPIFLSLDTAIDRCLSCLYDLEPVFL